MQDSRKKHFCREGIRHQNNRVLSDIYRSSQVKDGGLFKTDYVLYTV